MPIKNFNMDEIEGLSKFFDEGDEPEQGDEFDPKWRPTFKPIQQQVFDSKAPYVLAYGERFSGKSFVMGNKLVEHLWEEFNAQAVIIVGTKNQAMAGGIWYKLSTEILPVWCSNTGMVIVHEGRDDQKNPFIDVSNVYGGKSRVTLLSAPWPEVLKDRIRGYEISFLFFEEATTVPPHETSYFSAVTQQIGRRKGIKGVQQYCIATNPDSPQHWIWRRWVVDNHDNDDYSTFHVPMEEAREFMPKGYYERVLEACKNDDVLYRRLVKGEWVEQPSGTAIFANHFFEGLHQRGDPHSKKRLIPNPEYPCIVGYDPGAANNAIAFMQRILTTNGFIWVQFDEMVYLNRHLKFRELVPALLKRMHTWNQVIRRSNTNFQGFKWEHISDNSAFNQRRQAGDLDVLEIERESRRFLSANQGRYPGIQTIKMKEAPKFNKSRKIRVQILQGLLESEEYILDAHCRATRDMFNNLESEDPLKDMRDRNYDPDRPFTPKRGPHIHIFDAVTYPILYYAIKGTGPTMSQGPEVTISRLGG